MLTRRWESTDLPAEPFEQPDAHRLRRQVLRWLSALPPLLTAYWLVAHYQTVDGGLDRLNTARPGWLVAASAASAAMVFAAALGLQGSVRGQLRWGPLLAAQFASSCVSHVLPSGLGGLAVSVRHLRCQGLSYRTAVTATGLDTVAGIIVHAVLLGLLLVSGDGMGLGLTVRIPVVLGLSVGVLAGASMVLFSSRRLRVRAGAYARTWLLTVRRQLEDLGHRRQRFAQLFLGSAALPVLHGLALASVTRSLGVPVSAVTVFTVYLLASSVSAAVPSLGGLGALDAALAFGLHRASVPLATAVTGVVLYRLITVWLPLAPSALTLLLLRRRAWL